MPTPDSSTSPSPYDQLVDAASKGTAIAFVGAGSSIRVGYPSWGSLLDQLAELSIKAAPAKASYLAKLVGADVLARAQAYEDTLERPSFRQHLAQAFGPREPQFTEFHSDLVAIPFRHVLTTNYDDVLIAAYSAQRGCHPPIVDIGVDSDRSRFLTSYTNTDYPCQYVFLHGRASSPDGMLLTQNDYDNRYVNGPIGRQLKGGIFTTSQIVFVGFSLKDEDFMYLLRQLAGELGLTEPRHFALMEHPGSDEEVDKTTINLARKYGVTPLFYERSDDHAALASLIKRLSQDAAVRRRDRDAQQLAVLATVKISEVLSIILKDEPTSRARAIEQLPDALKLLGWPAMADSGANGTTAIDTEIDSTFKLIELGHPDEAIARYREIERAHAGQMDNRLRYRIKANIASAMYAKGDDIAAGQLYLEATAIYRESKNARGLEVVGYHLIGDDTKAAKAAETLCTEYPDFARAHAFRIRSAPKDTLLEDAVRSVPESAREDAEVLFALSDLAWRRGELDVQEAYLRRVLAGAPTWLDAVAMTATVILQREKAEATTDIDRGYLPQSPSRVEEAERLLTQALIHPSMASSERKARLLFNRSVARRMLGKMDEGKADVLEAFAVIPQDVEVALGFAIEAESTEDLDTAVSALRALAPDADNELRVIFMLALLMRRRKRGNDLDDAITSIRALISRLDTALPPAYRFDVLRLACQLFMDQQRPDDALAFVAQVPSAALHPAMRAVLVGRCTLKRDGVESATPIAREAVSRLDAKLIWLERREVALLAQDCKLWDDALSIWKDIVPTDRVNSDTDDMLRCAVRARDSKFILDRTRTLRLNGHHERKFVELEVETLVNSREPLRAIEVLQGWIGLHVDDEDARLALSVIGLQEGISEIVTGDAAKLPSVAEVPSAERGQAVAHVLRRAGDPMKALQYAYSLWRRFPESMGSEWALISGLLDPSMPQFTFMRPSIADEESAVLLARKNEQPHWITIESDNPRQSYSEYAPEHDLARAVIGKRADDSFVFQDHEYLVKAVEHKIVRRVHELMERFEERYPRNPLLRRFSMNEAAAEDAPVEEKLGDIFKELQRYDEFKREWLNRYQGEHLPIAFIARQTGKSVFETMRGIIAMPDLQVKCVNAEPARWKQALNDFGSASEIVLDDTALTTVFVLQMYDVLKRLPMKLIVPRSVVNQIRQASLDASVAREPRGYIGLHNGRPYIHEVTPEQMAAEVVALEQLLMFVKEHCQVEGGLSLQELPVEIRRVLTRFVGDGAADAIAIARARKALLWTDDLAVAAIAEHPDLALHRVWVQAILIYAGNNKALDRRSYIDQLGALMVGGYSVLGIAAIHIVELLKSQQWNPKTPVGRALARLMATLGVEHRQNRLITGLSILIVWKNAPDIATAKRCIIDLLEAVGNRELAVRLAKTVYRELPMKYLRKQGLSPLKQFLRSWRSRDGVFKPR